MNIFPTLQAVLYAISTALLYPVVLLLILLSLWMLIYAGGFLAEWIKRRQFRANGHLSDSLEIIQQEHRVPVEMVVDGRLNENFFTAGRECLKRYVQPCNNPGKKHNIRC